jgi:hypothetical protein
MFGRADSASSVDLAFKHPGLKRQSCPPSITPARRSPLRGPELASIHTRTADHAMTTAAIDHKADHTCFENQKSALGQKRIWLS